MQEDEVWVRFALSVGPWALKAVSRKCGREWQIRAETEMHFGFISGNIICSEVTGITVYYQHYLILLSTVVMALMLSYPISYPLSYFPSFA